MKFDMNKVYLSRTSIAQPGMLPNFGVTVKHDLALMLTFDELLGLQDHINSRVEEVLSVNPEARPVGSNIDVKRG